MLNRIYIIYIICMYMHTHFYEIFSGGITHSSVYRFI